MYESFYGLNEHPFNLTPDPDFLFINKNFGDALDQITYAVNRRAAFAAVIGDVGTGKTTLCWALLHRMGKGVRTALILNPLLDPEDMLRATIQDFGIKPGKRRAPWHVRVTDDSDQPDTSWLKGLDREALIEELKRFLLEGAKAELGNVLVIDEAQNLSPEVLELLNTLSDLETSGRKLLQIIFAGQLEFEQKLSLPQLQRLERKITQRSMLQPLSRQDMTRYIHHRIWRAGGRLKAISFSQAALNKIYEHSEGYPRLVNIICDRALRAGHSARSWDIDAGMVRAALDELGMSEKKSAHLPFPSRRAVTVSAGLILLAAISIPLRPWSYIAGIRDHWKSGASAAAGLDSGTGAASQPTGKGALSGDGDGTAGGNRTFYLQVHSLNTQEQADRAVRDLKLKGYPTFQHFVVNADNTGWYVVYVGQFDNLQAAQEAERQLLQQEHLPSIVRSTAHLR